MESKVRPATSAAKATARSPIRAFAVVGITLLAIALGGATELWAQGIILILASGIIMFFPPRRIPGVVPVAVICLFMILALSAFLPVSWSSMPEWRRHLTEDLQVPLGPFRTPQPWLTLQGCALLFFGLTWIFYLLALEWTNADKSLVLRLLVAGIIFLATTSIVSYLTGYRIPGWDQEQNRGWFPNRNQSANVLALAGIINYVIVFRSLQRKQASVAFWTTGLVLIGVALVICYSRAGILLFFAGIGLWHLTGLFRPRKTMNLAVGGTAVLLLLSLFLLFGGTTLERFLKVPNTSGSVADDYRILIQQDALLVSLQAPFLGVGLGNFEPIFTSMRQASADQNRTLHPESDWLWLAVEMGWLAPLLIIIGLRWWTWECLPFEIKQGESMRRAAMVASFIFILHGFIDVAGHRLGSVLVGMLVACMALSSRQRGSSPTWVRPLFRYVAMASVLIGAWWVTSAWAEWGPPTTATLKRVQARIDLDASKGKLASVSEDANAALAIEPLNWTYYFRRGSAEAFRNGGTDAAIADFRVGRFLEPHSVDLCLYEGAVWLGAEDPTHCLEAWREALRRAGAREITVYTTVLALSQTNPEVHLGLAQDATNGPDYLITFLNFATPNESKQLLDNLLSRDPVLQSFNSDQQRKLFAAWYAHGDRDVLASLLLSHVQWQVTGWKYLAQHYADNQDFQMASMTALRYLQRPVIKQNLTESGTSTQTSHFNTHPDDVIEGIRLCQAQVESNQLEEALVTISKLEKLKDCPRYIFYLKAQLCVKKQLWEEAWNSLEKLDEM